MTIASLIPALFVPLVGWRLYSRIRKSTGKQPFNLKKLWTAVILLPLCLLLVGLAVSRDNVASLQPLLIGGAVGIALAFFNLKHTQFDAADRTYVPNPYIGTILILLFVARIAYRFWELSRFDQAGELGIGNPSSTGILLFGIVAGYYTAYYAGLLRLAKRSSDDR